MLDSLKNIIDAMFKHSIYGIYLLDDNTNIIYKNAIASEMIDLKTEEMIQQKLISDSADGFMPVRMNQVNVVVEYKKITLQKATFYFVIIADINHCQKAEIENHIYKKMLNSVQDALYLVNKEGEELFYNKNIERYEQSYRKKMLKELMTVFKNKTPVVEKYRRFMTRDHREVHFISSYIPVKYKGEVIAVYSVNKYITKIKQLLDQAFELQKQLHSCTNNNNINGTSYTFSDIVGESVAIKSLIEKAKKLSLSDVPVLVYGETGTGKELFTQSIHNYSSKAKEPFIAINCAAIPENLLESILFGSVEGAFTGANNSTGLFEQAGKGTLFLDEINNMSLSLQAKLMRAIQEKKVRKLGGKEEEPINCRIVSSTNNDPKQLIEEGKLRKDFFYRIAVANLTIPPLRERKEDIFILAEYYLEKYNHIYGKRIKSLSNDLYGLFLEHSWPGNVRELAHILEGAVNVVEDEKELTKEHLPDYFCPDRYRSYEHDESIKSKGLLAETERKHKGSLPQYLYQVEKNMILGTLKSHAGNLTQSAKALGIHRQNLQARMKKLGIAKYIEFE